MGSRKKIITILFILFTFVIPSLAEDIHEAVKTGDIERLKKILGENPSLVNSPDKDKMTPLHHAVDTENLKVISLLISHEADVNAVNYKKETSLHIAVFKGNADAVKLLLKHGADHTKRDMHDRIPLLYACGVGKSIEAVKLLIDAGSDVNDKNSRGETIILSALYAGQKEIIDLLIDRGATLPNDKEILQRILYVTASNNLKRPFDIAVEKSEKQDMEWWKVIPIHACAQGGSVEIAKALIDKGANFGQKNRYGLEPLHIASENGRTEFVEFLLSMGAEIDSPSLMGKTALHFAQENEHSDLAALLVRKGASQAPPQFPILKGDYLGQPKPGDTPRMFAPGIVSDYSSEHSPAVFSPDLKEVYWTRGFRGPILYMKQENGVWTAPKSAPFCSEYGDGEPIFSPDGKKLFFLSSRPLKPGGPSDKENMWYVARTQDGWSEPNPVSPLINAFDLHWLFSLAHNGTIYFSSPSGDSLGMRDIYSSRFVNGKYEEPKNLGTIINTTGNDHTPFIAPDESYLIYVSPGKSSSPGGAKFHISYRNTDGTWMEPVSLGQKINSLRAGLCPAVTPDGKYMFFISQGDIYWVSAKIIQDLKPKELK